MVYSEKGKQSGVGRVEQGIPAQGRMGNKVKRASQEPQPRQQKP